MAEPTPSKYLQYLPAIFQRMPQDQKSNFLGQFLRPFEDVFDSFEKVLATVDRNFSPALAPAPDFLPWLATWLALVLDEEWDEGKRRRLLAEAMELYQWRGTVTGLKRYLEIYTGLEPEAIDIRECRLPAGMQIGVASRIGGVVRLKTPGTSPSQRSEIKAESRDYYLVDAAAPLDLDPSKPAAISAGDRVRFTYPADWVQRIKLEENGVRLWYRQPAPDDKPAQVHEVFHKHPDSATPPAERKPNITRCNDLIDYVATHSIPGSDQSETIRGGTFFIEEIEVPYGFTVIIHDLGRLFSDRLDSVGELDAGLLPKQLREQFVQHKVPLTANARVEIEQAGQKWMIVDATKKYPIRLEDHKLNIYRQFDEYVKKVRAILDAEKPAHTQYYLKFTPMAGESRRRFMQIGIRSSIGADTLIS